MTTPRPNIFSLAMVAFFSIAPSPGSSQALISSSVSPNDSRFENPFFGNGIDHLNPGALPIPKSRTELPKIFSPSRPRTLFTTYPWKNDIVTTVFWVGEQPTRNNPVPNTSSSWDPKWTKNFGGFDDPDRDNRDGWLPKKFIPKQNPFYIALPYNDTANLKTKASARKHVPWFEDAYYRDGKSVVKGRWIAIRRGDKVCYGQWEDCGPFETDNWSYVFGDKRPNTTGNGGAGLDVSPAICTYLGFRWNGRCDWRFVELHEIPDGPWKTWGNNNPFAQRSSDGTGNFSESITKIREMRELMLNPKKEIPDEEPVANNSGDDFER